MSKYYAVVEEVRKAEFTFTDEDMQELVSPWSDDPHAAASAFADEELGYGTTSKERYVEVYPVDDGVE